MHIRLSSGSNSPSSIRLKAVIILKDDPGGYRPAMFLLIIGLSSSESKLLQSESVVSPR